MYSDKMVCGRHAKTSHTCLPTSERLKIITLNCAARITHRSSKLLDMKSHYMGDHDDTSSNPVAQTPKSGYIPSMKQLI